MDHDTFTAAEARRTDRNTMCIRAGQTIRYRQVAALISGNAPTPSVSVTIVPFSARVTNGEAESPEGQPRMGGVTSED